jgi:hypothetical protein
MKHIFILITICLFSLGISAQDNQDTIKSSKIYFAYGQTYNLKLDRTYSRLAKNGFNHLFNLGYVNVNNNRIIDIQGSFMFGNLKTKGNSINIINDYAGNIKLKYLKKVNKINHTNLSLYIGGNIDFRGDIWFPQNNELRYGWDINLRTGLSTSLCYKINPKLMLQYDLDIPMIGILWRPHNNGQQLITEEIQLEKGIVASAFETPRFSHLFNTVYIDNSFKLFYSVSKKVNMYYNFAVSYRHIKKPLVKKGYEFNNAIGIGYKF